VTSTDELRDLLSAVPLFSTCNPSDLSVVARPCSIREVRRGTTVVRAGEMSDEFFVLLSGSAQRGHGEHARTLGTGDHFGELAPLDPAPRALDVVATADCTLGVLSRESFLLALDAVSGLSLGLLALLARRPRRHRRDVTVGSRPAAGQPNKSCRSRSAPRRSRMSGSASRAVASSTVNKPRSKQSRGPVAAGSRPSR
jgi:CRP-like cAMP-binding protein